VLVHQTPEPGHRDLVLLGALGVPIRSSPATLARGCTLAVDLEHHLFDRLYHATALE